MLTKPNHFMLLAFGLILSGCAAQVPRATTLADGSTGFSVSCNGSAYSNRVNWGTCFESANKACPVGFDVMDREQRTVDDDMAMRTLYFKCKP